MVKICGIYAARSSYVVFMLKWSNYVVFMLKWSNYVVFMLKWSNYVVFMLQGLIMWYFC